MEQYNLRIQQLQEKIALLSKQQDDFYLVINKLKNELLQLQMEVNALGNQVNLDTTQSIHAIVETPINIPEALPNEEIATPDPGDYPPIAARPIIGSKNTTNHNNPPNHKPPIAPQSKPPVTPNVYTKSSLEKFIGENLINKIGIAILIIGVAIGAKYSIDHNLISPLTRIILGYLLGFGLILVGMKLKAKYHNFSAVLVSGAMTIMYFLTYAAYSYYAIFNQVVAFGLMVIFTIFTILASLNYNRQIIAIIGLVGAYAVPLLLSDGSGRVMILFTYVAIINIGILIVSFKKNWKLLFYAAFGLSWLIYIVWFAQAYTNGKHELLAFSFLTIYFLTFYVIILAYKLLENKKYAYTDFVLIFINAVIFFGFGYLIISYLPNGDQYMGLFTLLNGLIHFIIGTIVYRKKLVDEVLFYFIFGLVLTFLTIAIPIQFNGNWVTLFWSVEALVFFYIARKKQLLFYEYGSYILLFISAFSLFQDWIMYNQVYGNMNGNAMSYITFTKMQFYSTLLFAVVLYLFKVINDKFTLSKPTEIQYYLKFVFTGGIIILLYFAFRTELSNYWTQAYLKSIVQIKVDGDEYISDFYNSDIRSLKTIWIAIYSCGFITLITWINIKKYHNVIYSAINMIINIIFITYMMIVGLYEISELRAAYLQQDVDLYFKHNSPQLGLRYLVLACISILVYSTYVLSQKEYMKATIDKFKVALEIMLYAFVLWILSSELLSWLDLGSSANVYKLGLSILWGVFALGMIIIGIWKQKAHIRLAAIVLFGFTILKLFFYDIANLNTISKTIVFVSLGILLLITSFLYNKYKHIIANNDDKEIK